MVRATHTRIQTKASVAKSSLAVKRHNEFVCGKQWCVQCARVFGVDCRVMVWDCKYTKFCCYPWHSRAWTLDNHSWLIALIAVCAFRTQRKKEIKRNGARRVRVHVSLSIWFLQHIFLAFIVMRDATALLQFHSFSSSSNGAIVIVSVLFINDVRAIGTSLTVVGVANANRI